MSCRRPVIPVAFNWLLGYCNVDQDNTISVNWVKPVYQTTNVCRAAVEEMNRRALQACSCIASPRVARMSPSLRAFPQSSNSFSRVAWSILDCARRTSTFLSCAFREQVDGQAALPILLRPRVARIPSSSLHRSSREWPRLPSTARIERAHSYRARSASKEGAWPLPPPS